MRKLILPTCLLLLVSAIAVVYLEPGAGRTERQYAQIQKGMSEEAVAEILGSERSSRAEVRLYFNGLLQGTEPGIASVWKFKEWGRPIYVLVGFDQNGRVLWKHIIKGAYQKVNLWLFNRETEGVDRPLSWRWEENTSELQS